jgi:NAD(P)H-hydrate repair Nnr-like enzyme with NAD(P)H-hydrate epimerase domain
MTRLITREQQKVLDSRFSEVMGLPSILLMEQAASGLSEFIVDPWGFPGTYADGDCGRLR